MVPGNNERLPEPDNYVKYFYNLQKNVAEAQRKKEERKKYRRNNMLHKRDRRKVDMEVYLNCNDPFEIELSPNASAFSVFANVRSAILKRHAKINNEAFRRASCISSPLKLSDILDSESEDEDKMQAAQSLPKIVGMGLRCLFTILKECRSIEPVLCMKVLSSLLDVLQGLLPEDLKFEPSDVIDPLFDILLDFATSHGPESAAANDGSHLTAMACACLLSLIVAKGDTHHLLVAITALLMCPRALADQNIQMPHILASLQKSVHTVLIGKLVQPDWTTYGVPKNSLTTTLKLPSELNNIVLNGRSFVSDGKYFYLHTNRGLIKIGSGRGGTIWGHIYVHKADFYPNDPGWLGYANNCLYFKCTPKKQSELLIIDAETLVVTRIAVLRGRDWSSSVMLSDGQNLQIITAGKDGVFVVRTINTLSNPLTSTSESPLKLAKKCVEIFGYAEFDEEQDVHTLNPDSDDEILTVAAGKEFCLAKTASGKLLYTGKGTCLGMKYNTGPNTWVDLPLEGERRVVTVAVGHNGEHAILVMEDGTVLFVGTVKRGEDGGSSKGRRQSKPVKPKKITKVEGQVIVNAACNNGSTALVTKEGLLLMFGKDTLYSETTIGCISDLKDTFVVNVSLGKAHAAVLTNKGHLFTFGINNKGQCGRVFPNAPYAQKEAATVAMDIATVEDETVTGEEEGTDQEQEWEVIKGICPPGQHQWSDRLCMVCTICRECTGYGTSCLSSIRPDRNPGQECGCGEGDSGCAECGCCVACAKKSYSTGRIGPGYRGYLQKHLGEIRQRRSNAGPSTVKYGMTMKGVQRSASNAVQKGSLGLGNNISGEGNVGGNDIERTDATRIVSLPPARVPLPSDSPVVQVSCGLHHTVVLLGNGEVYTFGSNIHGQLGVGDLVPHIGPVQVKIPSVASQVAAGNNHTVVLTLKGEVYTFGEYQKGQLGTNWWSGQTETLTTAPPGDRTDASQPWHSFPNVVPNIGPRWGRRATWIGASGDQTYIKIDEMNSISLTRSTVLANQNCIILIPHHNEHVNSFKCLVVSKRDGTCNSFSGADQIDFSNCVTTLDPLYNVIWTFSLANNDINFYNIISTEARHIPCLDSSILKPALSLPVVPNCFVTRYQAAMYLLACLDTLTQAQDENLTVEEESKCNQSNHCNVYSREDFITVCRFEGLGGGWGYNGHSIEAIRFMSDTNILLGGYGLFGGRGEYTAKVKLFDIGVHGGDREIYGEPIAETEEVPYECGPRQKYSILFDRPVPLQANRWYVAWAKVTGPASDCGSGGVGTVMTEDQITFHFKSSKRSNNGTDVNAGQIPQLLYRLVTDEKEAPKVQKDSVESVYILKREFSRTVTKECFDSLVSLLQWSWNTLKAELAEASTYTTSSLHTALATKRLEYISKACLRLLRTYTNEIYPNQPGKKTVPESVGIADCIGDVRALLRQILSDTLPLTSRQKTGTPTYGNQMTDSILEECHKTFVSCYNAFYPTAYLKWASLCQLVSGIDKDQGIAQKDRLLSAVLASLCNSTIRLRYTFPILTTIMDESDSAKRQFSPSENTNLPLWNTAESRCYPILVEQMTYRTQAENSGKEIQSCSFREVFDRLLDLILVPVKKSLCKEKNQCLQGLVMNCSYLLARVIAELAAQSSGVDDELGAFGRVIYSTPSRFTRMTQTKSWNTGNGSPDAVCFTVDKPGIVIVGASIYAGEGQYEYELEVLIEQNVGSDPSLSHHWAILECTKGTFGPDDCFNDVVDLKFDKPVPIKENIKYAIRLRNRGSRTCNGDGGLTVIKGSDGTTFTFTSCSLSFNGTTQARGQIPHILYYSNPLDLDGEHTNKAVAEMQAKKWTIILSTTIIQRSNEIFALARERAEDIVVNDVLGNATFVTTLLPLVMDHISPLATSDPKSGVQILTLIQEMLPHVAALNLLSAMGTSQISQNSETQSSHFTAPVTTSHYYTWLESDHPYKPATVSHYKVSFPDTVKWITVEFTPECGTAQPDDYLQLYIPNIGTNGASRQAANATNDDAPLEWPVLHKLSNDRSKWPQNAVVLPGHEVIFSLETASDYMKNERAMTYGFKCLVIGYDWITSGNGLKNLEIEVSFLGGACAASLMKKNLSLPAVLNDEPDENTDIVQDAARKIFSMHSDLLGRGFSLASQPTISQALDGVLPFSCHSYERVFLRDFISYTSGTSGGRLARWLQPESFLDPSKCQALFSRDEIKCGWPANIIIVTRDQYGEVVGVPNLKLVVKAVPIDNKDMSDADQNRKIRRISRVEPMTFGGHPQPPTDIPYEVTIDDKTCLYPITVMKAYENYSFEEIRLFSPTTKRTSEILMFQPNGDGTYSSTWTPSSAGWYSLIITMDGYQLEDNYRLEVKEAPQGSQHLPPGAKKHQSHPSRMRKFMANNSNGLRVRSHPSLQGEQIGIVPLNGIITSVDELYNDDGHWLRLNVETTKKYCNTFHFEAWCLQHNNHLRKTLLFPLEEPKTILEEMTKETHGRKESDTVEEKRKTVTFDGGKTMVVTKCGASGHNIRSKPSLKADPVGMLALGYTVTVRECFVSGEGTWVRIDDESVSKYCFDKVRSSENETWCLAVSKDGVTYMKTQEDLENESTERRTKASEASSSHGQRGFDFATPMTTHDGFNFNPPVITPTTAECGESSITNPFVFGSCSQHESPTNERYVSERTDASSRSSKKYKRRVVRESETEREGEERDKEKDKENNQRDREKDGSGKSIIWHKWLRGEERMQGERRSSSSRDINEFAGVSVKEMVKTIGESRANGNGSTPPDTPRRLSRSSSPRNPQGGSPRFQSPSSSPVAIPGGRSLIGGGDSISSSPVLCGSPRSVGLSPLVSGGMLDSITSQRRGSTQSDTSALVSSLTRDPSQSPSGISTTANTRDLSPSPSCSSLQMRSEGSIASPPQTPKKDDCTDSQERPGKVCQVTQTSPRSETTTMKGHFSIGVSGGKEDRLSPKHSRRDYSKVGNTRTKRSMSPASQAANQSANGSRTLNMTKEKVKEAMSPSMAESMRAVFAAFLWHEGIVHDAIACASFLKFHPNLPKQGALVVTRQSVVQPDDKEKQELRARQRHSVEVTNAGNYLHIQPSTLETLTRSAANASANRSRKKQETIIKEEDQSASKLGSLPELHTVAVLPPALKSLVFLWEEVTTNCMQVIEQHYLLPSPLSQAQTMRLSKRASLEKYLRDDKNNDRDRRVSKKKREWRSFGRTTAAEGLVGIEREMMCELCGLMFPHPVTYHMKLMHPGCGWHAGGKGYNSGGNYCVGWAGNCGDGGFGVSSWYLICDTCRNKYLKERKLKQLKFDCTGRRKNGPNKNTSPIKSPIDDEPHIMMKNKAIFLLDLASASGLNIPKQQRRPSQTLSSVAENSSPPDVAGPFPPTGPFQCLQALGIHNSQSNDEKYYEEALRRQSEQQTSEEAGDVINTTSGRPLSEYFVSDSDSENAKYRGVFHRSVSMSTGAPWARNGNDGRVVMRRRNNSSSELNNNTGSSLLCYPSAALQKLVPSMDQSMIVSTSQAEVPNADKVEILMRPVMLFILEQNNLHHLQFGMRQAMRRAACRMYAMQALNWLLRSVTQPICLHDLLWWFVASLTPVVSFDSTEASGEEDKTEKKEDHDMMSVYEHPLSDLVIAGESVNSVSTAFHTVLQTIADLMLLPPPGSPLQQAAIRCWGIKFTPADHAFLHRSHVFSNISKMLSRSEEEEDVAMSMHESHQSGPSQEHNSFVETLKDLTASVDFEASSRQAMVGALTDNSTETFWESGDEDRHKTKLITIICKSRMYPRLIYVHIDNCRDLTHKVCTVTFVSGINPKEMIKMRTVELRNRFAGWVSCRITDSRQVLVGIELKGPDNSLRVRQIRVLGEVAGESLKIGKQMSAQTIQQKHCETETLKVFRIITSQVFGKLIQGAQEQQMEPTEGTNDEIEDSNNLREHMVGILFSRSKLTDLQKQVCAHIVQAIRKETLRIREEWEVLLNSPTPATSVISDNSDLSKAADAYCFEMLYMVLALSGNTVGQYYLSHQYGLLKDLLSLLHTGSARVQRQVTAALRRILPKIKPETFAKVVGAEKLPPTNLSIITASNSRYDQPTDFSQNSMGILDVFLSCIAKALTVQVKIKGKGSGKALQTVTLASSIHPKSNVGNRWWLRGSITRKLADEIIQLLKDMASGKLSLAWASVTKAAVAENILNLTTLDERSREPSECLQSPTLWLALSSLCVMDADHADKLTSGEWRVPGGQPPPPKPTCNNHDDDTTIAIIQCNVCGNLCGECDKILHLHRKTRMHARQVFKEEEEAIRVDLHEDCGRTKLFWVLAVADNKSLKALVEFRAGTPRRLIGATSGICRFCGTTGNTGLLAIGNVCADHDCQEHAKNACTKFHGCGHICGGVRNEKSCLPCLHGCLPTNELKQDADDMCMICFTEALSCAPAIQLQCGHVFHLHCCRQVLTKKWSGPRITFGFTLCPICKMSMEHPTLIELLANIKELYEDVKRKALMRLEYEGYYKAEASTAPASGRSDQELAMYAMDRYAYYVCYKCQKAYYGGEARCDALLGGEVFDPKELVCGRCSDVAKAQMCPKHGTDFLEYKCRYCCSMAVFFCFGTTHFCSPCHDDFQLVTTIPKNELPSCPAGPRATQLEGDECPLYVKHPPTGEEHALGCGICRNAHMF